jgi:hypothetical protein
MPREDHVETLLARCLGSEDTAEVEQLHREILTTLNAEREARGLSLLKEPQTVLITATHQLRRAGVRHETLLGDAILHHSLHTATATEDPLFDQFFVEPTTAQQFKDLTLTRVEEHVQVDRVTVFPPLLARSLTEHVLTLHIRPDGTLAESGVPNAALVLHAQGPIVPVLADPMPNVKMFLRRLYALQGVLDPSQLRAQVQQ